MLLVWVKSCRGIWFGGRAGDRWHSSRRLELLRNEDNGQDGPRRRRLTWAEPIPLSTQPTAAFRTQPTLSPHPSASECGGVVCAILLCAAIARPAACVLRRTGTANFLKRAAGTPPAPVYGKRKRRPTPRTLEGPGIQPPTTAPC
jgi:hypothetical protein